MREKPVMRLEIEVRLSGCFPRPRARYALVGSTPPAVLGLRVVRPNGDIDLRKMPRSFRFMSRVDITFHLIGTVRSDGRHHTAVFQTPASAAFRAQLVSGRARGRLEPLFAGKTDRSRLTVQDPNNDDARYHYCLRVTALRDGKLLGKLDPSIVNR